ncbi:selenocysteine-specific elongation factor-like isoform X1 [Haliotis rufescens]|uniref:selenocysteine-specific elongation factor-like isoform X1 n=2 Tax=Haliotis rufescens TaxID=6454 RepID=UPI001EB05C76|nr:selenocysteine-specific elongation factor-like isoform X1 [Haliotis rufescens]
MESRPFNFNVGVLGHVDSGKTSLSKALSSVASTACFDKNPQSKERGITLDLGFSSFSIQLDDDSKEKFGGHDRVQYTLVDCPGHASLIRTIIGGAQIIDMMLLVVDVVKGMQTQTAECLVIGEILCHKMIVVINKMDLLPSEKRSASFEKMKKRMLKTLETTRFKDSPVIAVSACTGSKDNEMTSEGMNDLISLLVQHTYLPLRSPLGNFIFSVDHCFAIRGQGTVLTGTVLAGKATVGDALEFPTMKVNKKIKSIQMFKKPVDFIQQGDRAGVCVTQFDPKLLERGFVCTPGSLSTTVAALVSIHKISHFKGNISNKSKYHITVGHDTVMGHASFFRCSQEKDSPELKRFNFSQEYEFQEEVSASCDTVEQTMDNFALLQFDRPVVCLPSAIFIGSKLDSDVDANVCRLAFHGNILESFADADYLTTVLPKVKVVKVKRREGLMERATDKYTVIAKNLFKKETDITLFTGMQVELSSGQKGTIQGSFGKSGKVKIQLSEGLSEEVYEMYCNSKKKSKEDIAVDTPASVKVILNFKRYVYDPLKVMKQ